MKSTTCYLAAIVGFAAFAPAWRAAEEAKAPKAERKELRVLSSPERERRSVAREGDRRERLEMERVAFLGVEVSPVPAALGAQLRLPRGTGLVVGHVAPKSAAAGVLQEHDILLKLDEQILIEPRQLAVLIRNHQEGDEVTVAYMRGGQRSTTKVKLGTHEVPKLSWQELPGPAGGRFEFRPGDLPPGPARAEVDRVLSLIRESHRGGPAHLQIERRAGPGFRAMSIHPGNSRMVFNDDAGTIELSIANGAKSVVVTDRAGAQVFAGPVTTPAERHQLPPVVRERLERFEHMREMSFETDEDFKAPEVRVVRPPPRSIALPGAPASPAAISQPF
jgi:hypothetical protein